MFAGYRWPSRYRPTCVTRGERASNTRGTTRSCHSRCAAQSSTAMSKRIAPSTSAIGKTRPTSARTNGVPSIRASASQIAGCVVTSGGRPISAVSVKSSASGTEGLSAKPLEVVRGLPYTMQRSIEAPWPQERGVCWIRDVEQPVDGGLSDVGVWVRGRSGPRVVVRGPADVMTGSCLVVRHHSTHGRRFPVRSRCARPPQQPMRCRAAAAAQSRGCDRSGQCLPTCLGRMCPVMCSPVPGRRLPRGALRR